MITLVCVLSLIVIGLLTYIHKVGKQTYDWTTDVEGKKESKVSKAVRGAVQFATKAVKKAANEAGVLDDEVLAALEAGADMVENQAKAKPGTSWKDRAKMGGVCVAYTIWWTVCDCMVLSTVAGIAGHGLNMASNFVPNEIGQGTA